MELQHISEFEKAVAGGRGELVRFGVSFLFMVGVMFFAAAHGAGRGELMLVMTAIVAAYMAMNIGANDVANNVGPAVGAKAFGLVGALALAATFDVAGALLAGERVIERMRSGILHPGMLADPQVVVWVMLAALLAGAVWINVASALGAPVSTTHAIVGAIMGSGIAARGPDIVNWPVMGRIAASWVVSPVLGGVLAAMFLYFIRRSITVHADMAGAARRVVPALLAVMAGIFTAFLVLEGLGRLPFAGRGLALSSGVAAGALTFVAVRMRVRARGRLIPNTEQGVNRLFTLPLMFAAAAMSFAHGSNDVANAVGPLAAVVFAVTHEGAPAPDATVAGWAMLVGALGIGVGLALFGPRVIRTIGSELTELDNMRAFSIATASALTVILASLLGLPISSTHVVVGSVLGVGFLREYLGNTHARMVEEIKAHHPHGDQGAIDDFMLRFEAASLKDKDDMLRELKRQSKVGVDPARFAKRERKALRRAYRRELVRRSQVRRILAAWLVTVPVSALTSAGLYHLLAGGAVR